MRRPPLFRHCHPYLMVGMEAAAGAVARPCARPHAWPHACGVGRSARRPCRARPGMRLPAGEQAASEPGGQGCLPAQARPPRASPSWPILAPLLLVTPWRQRRKRTRPSPRGIGKRLSFMPGQPPGRQPSAVAVPASQGRPAAHISRPACRRATQAARRPGSVPAARATSACHTRHPHATPHMRRPARASAPCMAARCGPPAEPCRQQSLGPQKPAAPNRPPRLRRGPGGRACRSGNISWRIILNHARKATAS